jgi:hypothetical protein
VQERRRAVNWWLLLLVGGGGTALVFVRLRRDNDTGVSLGIAIGSLLAGLAIVAYALRKQRRQVADLEQTGVLELEALVSFGSLRGDGPDQARASMPLRGFNARWLPARLTVEGDDVVVQKSSTFGAGRRPFRATFPLSDVAQVEVTGPTAMIYGSTMVVRFHDGHELVAHLGVGPEDGQRVADHVLLSASGPD